jgi:predicted ATP-binding protein involved in virulence
MRILRIQGKSVWGLDEIDLRPDGKSVAITGGTKRGKTSILKAIRDGFFGTVDGTIHDGATEGSILIETDEITIERIVDGDSKTKSLKVWRGDVAVNGPAVVPGEDRAGARLQPRLLLHGEAEEDSGRCC